MEHPSYALMAAFSLVQLVAYIIQKILADRVGIVWVFGKSPICLCDLF